MRPLSLGRTNSVKFKASAHEPVAVQRAPFPSRQDCPSYSLTIWNASTGPYGLQVGLVWFRRGSHARGRVYGVSLPFFQGENRQGLQSRGSVLKCLGGEE